MNKQNENKVMELAAAHEELAKVNELNWNDENSDDKERCERDASI